MEQKPNKLIWLESALKRLNKKAQSLKVLVKTKKRRRKKKKSILTPTPTCKRERMPKYHADYYIDEELESNGREFWNFVDEFFCSKSFFAKSKNYFLNCGKSPSKVKYAILKSIRNSLLLQSRALCQSPVKYTSPKDSEEGSSMTLRSRIVCRETDKSTVPSSNESNQGNSLSLRSRVVSRSSEESAESKNSENKSILNKEVNRANEKEALTQIILLKIQRARMRKATDIISKEYMKEIRAKKNSKLYPKYYYHTQFSRT